MHSGIRSGEKRGGAGEAKGSADELVLLLEHQRDSRNSGQAGAPVEVARSVMHVIFPAPARAAKSSERLRDFKNASSIVDFLIKA